MLLIYGCSGGLSGHHLKDLKMGKGSAFTDGQTVDGIGKQFPEHVRIDEADFGTCEDW